MATEANSPDTEIWKPVPGYDGQYLASSLGRVLVKGRVRFAGQGRVANVAQRVTFGSNDRGYRIIGLNTGRKLYVHRLVCEAFHGTPPKDRPHVAHFDGNKSNNRPDNLRWASCFENRQDGKRLGEILIGDRHPRARLNWDEVAAIRADFEATGGWLNNVSAFARKWGLTPPHMRDILTNRIWRKTA